MIKSPALLTLRQLAKELNGDVVEMKEFTNVFPNRWTDNGQDDGHQKLIDHGWDGNKLFGVVVYL